MSRSKPNPIESPDLRPDVVGDAPAVIDRPRQAEGDAEGFGQFGVALIDILAEGDAALAVDEGGPVEQADADLAAG